MSPGAAAYLRRAVLAQPASPTAPSINLAQVKAVIHDVARIRGPSTQDDNQVGQVAALPNAVFVDALADVSFEEQKRLRVLLRQRRSHVWPSPVPAADAAPKTPI